MKRFAVMASGAGSNFENIVRACQKKIIQGQVVGLLTDQPQALVLERAVRCGVATGVLPRALHGSLAEFDKAQAQLLRAWRPDYVVLAGYLKKIGPAVLAEFPRRILNIHPSLLPRYGGKGMYGRHVFEAVLAAQEKKSGITVHWVTDEYDSGDIVAQEELIIAENETVESLQRRTQELEHAIYVRVLAQLSEI